ncbi:hypothetical protein MM213_08455 [Belliella sp. R4-6]|uniref:Uncharacterized protein n=1 Tax=Belliella alkalica TaxID=1730871 RepID=A0ABS9VAP9_9BACT|nr:hypothetical protein [Belliella alkalica]MCH7413512.1 hypothetical protein [Belliella alkalica]
MNLNKISTTTLGILWCSLLLATSSYAQQRKVIRATLDASEKMVQTSLGNSEKSDSDSGDCDDDQLSGKFQDNELLRIFSFPCHFQGAVGNDSSEGSGLGTPSKPVSSNNPGENVKSKTPKDYDLPPPSIMQFDKKISYLIYMAPSELARSYFYHSTDDGLSIKDNKALEMMSKEKMDGQIHQVFDPHNERFAAYIKNREGAFYTIMNMGGDDDGKADFDGRNFFEFAKKSGRKTKVDFLGLECEEYVVFLEGKKVGIWLAKSPDVKFAGESPKQVLGYSGLGYVYDGKGNTYLIVGMRNSNSLILMTGYENINFSFDSRGYKGFNTYLTEQLGGNPFANGDPSGYNTMVEKQNSENWSQFMESNEILSLGQGYDSPDFTIEVYDMMIATMENHILGANTALSELRNSSGEEASRRRAEAQCNLNCYTKKKSEIENLKKQVLAIQKNSRISYDEKQDRLDEVYEKFGETQSRPCDCWN